MLRIGSTADEESEVGFVHKVANSPIISENTGLFDSSQ